MKASPLRYLYLLLAGLLFYASSDMLPDLARQRRTERLTVRTSTKGVPPSYALADGLLGGFRGFLIAGLWRRAADMKQAGEYHEMVDIYKIISTMEPNYPNAWANMAWDLSYNVAAEFEEDPNERVYWVFRGISMLRDQAIRLNPRAARLYYELSWIFYNKATESVDPAFPIYRRDLAIDVSKVLKGDGDKLLLEQLVRTKRKFPDKETLNKQPEFIRIQQELAKIGYKNIYEEAYPILATKPEKAKALWSDKKSANILQLIALTEINDQLDRKFNMSASVMLLLNRKFGPIDWRLPQAHALYWSWLGQKYKKEDDPEYQKLRYERLIYFSLIQLAHKGEGIISGQDYVIGAPKPEFVDNIISYMEDMLRRHKDDAGMGGVRSGFENFMRVTVFNYYFNDDRLNAERIRQKLVKFSNNKKEFGPNLTQFMSKQLPDFIDGLTHDRSMMLLISFCRKAYWYLANGNVSQYREQMAWFESNYVKLYDNWKETFHGTYKSRQQFGMPTVDELRSDMAAQIISGSAGFPEKLQNQFDKGLKKFLPKVWEKAHAKIDALNDKSIKPELLAPEKKPEAKPEKRN